MADKGLNNEAQLRSQLAEHELSSYDAELIHERVATALGDEASRFKDMKKLLGIADHDAATLKYSSVLWPGFDFNAIAGEAGRLEAARYCHTESKLLDVDSPSKLSTWSVDISEFAEHFGPMAIRGEWPLFDKFLPAYDEYEFSSNGERYSARFI